jgi:hypothetical protein
VKTFGRLLLYSLAFIGIVAIGYATALVLNWNSTGRVAKRYAGNCKKLNVGMTLEQVCHIMGDYSGTQPCIRTVFRGKLEYFIAYPVQTGGSEGPVIYFEPLTQKVTSISCGE